MRLCAICQTIITEDMLFYEISNLSEELATGLETLIKQENSIDDCLCEDCFNITSKQIKTENELYDEESKVKGENEKPKSSYDQSYAKENIPEYDSKSKKRKFDDSSDDSRIGHVSDESSCDEPEKVVRRKETDESDTEWIPPGQIKQFVERTNLSKRTQNTAEPSQIEVPLEEQFIRVPNYRIAPSTSSHCFVKGCKSDRRVRIPMYLTRVLLEKYNLFVPDNARSCPEHIKEYYRDWSFLNELDYNDIISYERITRMLNLLRENAVLRNDV